MLLLMLLLYSKINDKYQYCYETIYIVYVVTCYDIVLHDMWHEKLSWHPYWETPFHRVYNGVLIIRIATKHRYGFGESVLLSLLPFNISSHAVYTYMLVIALLLYHLKTKFPSPLIGLANGSDLSGWTLKDTIGCAGVM